MNAPLMPKSEPTRSRLKEQRLQRKLAKRLGLRHDATTALILATLRRLVAVRRANKKTDDRISCELAAQLDAGPPGQSEIEQALQLVAELTPMRQGVGAMRQRAASVALSEPLQAVRARA